MKKIIVAVLLLCVGNLAFAHGGGCRKNSPPGMCCHMDHRTGVVHCH